MYGYDWKPYVSVSQKKANGRKYAAKVAKKQKRACQPIQIEGRTIAKSFWGKAWNDHVESLSDYANRLPRGRTYVRNGSVVDLVITPGKVEAIVAGSDPYEISISIKKLNKKTWESIKKDCSKSIDSLLDLLGGRLSDGVMQRLTDKKSGCFPSARQIKMECDCPDWSVCCKHLAAVMYGVGSRLDSEPELLFLLRGVNQEELISQAVSKENLAQELEVESGDLAGEDLGAMFGIELDSNPKLRLPAGKTSTAKRKKSSKSSTKRKSVPQAKQTRAKQTRAKKAAVKKNPVKKSAKKASPKAANVKKKSAKKAPTKKKATKERTVAKKKSRVKKKAAKKTTAVKKQATAKPKVTAKKDVAAKQIAETKRTSAKRTSAKRKSAKRKSAKRKSATTKATRKKSGSPKSSTSKK
jgi:uncharacterized Zn finger protein